MKKRDFLKRSGAALSGAALTSMASIKAEGETVQLSEREWARALARRVAEQLPEAIRQVRGLSLSAEQIQELRKAYENTLITNMGCERRPTD
jgi:hypothetical protein